MRVTLNLPSILSKYPNQKSEQQHKKNWIEPIIRGCNPDLQHTNKINIHTQTPYQTIQQGFQGSYCSRRISTMQQHKPVGEIMENF